MVRIRRPGAAAIALLLGAVLALSASSPAVATGTRLTNPNTNRCLEWSPSGLQPYLVWVMACNPLRAYQNWVQIGVPPQVRLQNTSSGYCLVTYTAKGPLGAIPCNTSDLRQYWLKDDLWGPGSGTWRSAQFGGCLDATLIGPMSRPQICQWSNPNQYWYL